MTRVKTKFIVAAAVVAGFLFSSATTFLILHWRGSRAGSAARPPEPPFKFSHSSAGGEKENRSSNSIHPSGPADFTSNIPVIVLRGERPGPVSASKNYSPFKMEIYEPGTNEP